MLSDSHEKTLRLVRMAMLIAISCILVFINFPIIPAGPFLRCDLADVPILLAAMSMGGPAGMVVLIIAAAVEAFLLGNDGPIGFLMHVIASGAMILTARGIYKAGRETNKSMILGLICGAVARAAIMIPLNFIFTPKVMMDVPVAQSTALFIDALFGGYDASLYGELAITAYNSVKALLLAVLVPFNFIQAGLNSAIYFAVEKTLSKFLKKKTPTTE